MTDKNNESGAAHAKTSQDFLLAEYQGLIEIDKSRNDRLDRFLTLFLTLAASPWALYALISHEGKDAVPLVPLPLPLAIVFLLTGSLGFLIVMMFVQIRFLIILYMRAMNSIRGHFAKEAHVRDGLRLPIDGNVPPYYEPGSYVLFAVIGMGLVNSAYVAFGVHDLTTRVFRDRPLIAIFTGIGFFAAWFALHLTYYRNQAHRRETKDKGGKLTFRMPRH